MSCEGIRVCAALPLCSCSRYGMFEIIKFFCYRTIMHSDPQKTCDVDLGALGLESLSHSMNLQFLSFILAPRSLEPHFMERNLRVPPPIPCQEIWPYSGMNYHDPLRSKGTINGVHHNHLVTWENQPWKWTGSKFFGDGGGVSPNWLGLFQVIMANPN